jgi:hypothetical protein
MRTTLDLDDDVLLAARAHAAREKRSLGAVISELARESLQRPSAPAGRARGAGGAPVAHSAAALPCCRRARKWSPSSTCVG